MSSTLRYSIILCATEKKKQQLNYDTSWNVTRNTKMWKQKLCLSRARGPGVCVHISGCVYLT